MWTMNLDSMNFRFVKRKWKKSSGTETDKKVIVLRIVLKWILRVYFHSHFSFIFLFLQVHIGLQISELD